MRLKSRDLDKRITFLRKVPGSGLMSAGKETWDALPPVWAQVQDMLPSRGDKVAAGVEVTARPARIRIRFRTDITADMRIQFGDRLMKIVSAPAELGYREGLEIVAEDYTTTGNPA